MLGQGLRFLVVGGANTLLGYGIYCLLVIWLHPQLSWTLMYVIGIGISYVSHSRLVFRSSLNRRKAIGYALMQISMYLLGSAIIAAVMSASATGPRIAAAMAMCVTVPVSFLIARRLLTPRQTQHK